MKRSVFLLTQIALLGSSIIMAGGYIIFTDRRDISVEKFLFGFDLAGQFLLVVYGHFLISNKGLLPKSLFIMLQFLLFLFCIYCLSGPSKYLF